MRQIRSSINRIPHYEYVKQIGCATVLMSKRLNITLLVSTIAEDKYNGVKKAAGYVGSNPTILEVGYNIDEGAKCLSLYISNIHHPVQSRFYANHHSQN